MNKFHPDFDPSLSRLLELLDHADNSDQATEMLKSLADALFNRLPYDVIRSWEQYISEEFLRAHLNAR